MARDQSDNAVALLQGPAAPALEVAPGSPWCQRWTADRRHTWVRRSAGGFDASRYEVEALDERNAKAYVLGRHYSGTYPAAARRFGLYYCSPEGARDLVGVAVFSIPPSRAVLANLFPDLEPYVESLELGRFVLEGGPDAGSSRAPANSESWFLARCFRELAALGVRGVASFSDPVPRYIEGRCLFPGHVGTIYQASNARYTGRGAPATLVVLPDSTVLNNRAMSKVRSQERGHDYVERALVTLGAHPPRAGEAPARWLAAALEEVGARRLRHHGCHRYAFSVASDSRARRRVRLAPGEFAYPKMVDAT